ncbi:Gfo/Idh/MocA family oxidoreductase [Paradesertivirga mongoliensis]|uniref:Gfo/Idh/MocA family oxidoreductase n=1 Tax=Paradesertivirga mongoliensis TaxID=2100740 RepID=A0ABW4ZMZ2_9SPHI|nr:Gfo/Idh/MocA family oxidoreductase [Pedobacter mongoliensis]
MKEQIITGILSYGMSGRLFHAPFVETHKGFNFYAVTERTEKRASGRYPHVISYNSVDELLADPKVELVIVNTPNNTHFEFSRKALEAGKHVLVEKPFTSTVAEAKELFALAKRVGRHIMVYHNRRWDTDFQSVKTVINGGKLGKLIEVHFRFDRYRKEISKKAFKENPLPASGLSYDLGPHLLDQIISLFGKPLKWHKILGVFRPESLVDDYMHIHLFYPRGLNVFVTANLLTAHPLPAFVLHGTQGSFIKERTDIQEEQLDKEISPLDPSYGVERDGSEGIFTTIDAKGNKSTRYNTALKGNYSRLFDAVYNQIRKNEPYPVKEDEILWQIEILEGRSVKV